MDGATAGIVAGMLGGALGVLGGLVGTWCSIRDANGPRERAYVVKAALLGWALVLAFLAALFLVPAPWDVVLWLLYAFLLWWAIRTVNRVQARIRADEASRGAGGQGAPLTGP